MNSNRLFLSPNYQLIWRDGIKHMLDFTSCFCQWTPAHVRARTAKHLFASATPLSLSNLWPHMSSNLVVKTQLHHVMPPLARPSLATWTRSLPTSARQLFGRPTASQSCLGRNFGQSVVMYDVRAGLVWLGIGASFEECLSLFACVRWMPQLPLLLSRPSNLKCIWPAHSVCHHRLGAICPSKPGAGIPCCGSLGACFSVKGGSLVNCNSEETFLMTGKKFDFFQLHPQRVWQVTSGFRYNPDFFRPWQARSVCKTSASGRQEEYFVIEHVLEALRLRT